MNRRLACLTLAVCFAGLSLPTHAVTIAFFSPSQPASTVTSNITDLTLSSSGYLFTYSADGYWSAWPSDPPTGRFFSVFWPNGVQAQAITAGTNVGLGANITIKRVDGQPFDLVTFTGKILLNTAGAGGAFELMPQLNGQDAFLNPLQYDCTGYANMSFPCVPGLTGYDTYTIHMWGDFALTQLTLTDNNPLVPAALHLSSAGTKAIQLSWPADAAGYILQQSPSLTAPNWTAVTDMAQLVGTNIQVDVSTPGGNRFFRLVH